MTEYVTLKPPAVLYEPCTKPEPEKMETNADLIDYLLKLESAYSVCSAKIDSIRGYYDGNN